MYRSVNLLHFAAVNVFINLQLQVVQQTKEKSQGITFYCHAVIYIFSFFLKAELVFFG